MVETFLLPKLTCFGQSKEDILDTSWSIGMPETLPLLILIHPRRLFRRKSDLDRDDQDCASADVYDKVVEAIGLQSGLDAPEVPGQHYLNQNFP